MDRESGKFLIAIAVVVLILSVTITVVASRLEWTGAGIPFEPDAEAFQYCGLGSPDIRGNGQLPEYGIRQDGEIYDRTIVWFAWSQAGESFPIVGQGGTQKCADALVVTQPSHGYYLFEIKNKKDSPFVTFYQDRVPDGKWAFVGDKAWLQGDLIRFPTFSFQIDGSSFCTVPTTTGCPVGKEESITDGATLRVSLIVGRKSQTGGWETNPYSDRTVMQDQIQLRSAIPNVWWVKLGYNVGETAIANWKIPADRDVNGNAAYFIQLIDENTNLPLAGYESPKALTGTSGQERVLVTEALISNDLATCQNRLRAELWTVLIVADYADASVRSPATQIGGGAPPVVKEVTFNKPEYQEGDTVTISWKATGNITKYHVSAQIGGLTQYDEDVTGTSVTFTAPVAGVLEVQVTAYNLCVASDVFPVQATVGNVYPGLCTVYPDLPQCKVESIFALVVAVIALIGLLLLMLISWFVINKFELLPPFYNFLVAAILTVVVGLWMITIGVLDPFILPQTVYIIKEVMFR